MPQDLSKGMTSLIKQQELERKKEELQLLQRELERQGEQERLQGEINAVVAIHDTLVDHPSIPPSNHDHPSIPTHTHDYPSVSPTYPQSPKYTSTWQRLLKYTPTLNQPQPANQSRIVTNQSKYYTAEY